MNHVIAVSRRRLESNNKKDINRPSETTIRLCRSCTFTSIKAQAVQSRSWQNDWLIVPGRSRLVEKVSHANRFPVETCKLEHGPLDDERADEIWNQSVTHILQINARHCDRLFAKITPYFVSLSTNCLR
jgi:hypothetical protein